jgi:hypothetical protein
MRASKDSYLPITKEKPPPVGGERASRFCVFLSPGPVFITPDLAPDSTIDLPKLQNLEKG